MLVNRGRARITQCILNSCYITENIFVPAKFYHSDTYAEYVDVVSRMPRNLCSASLCINVRLLFRHQSTISLQRYSLTFVLLSSSSKNVPFTGTYLRKKKHTFSRVMWVRIVSADECFSGDLHARNDHGNCR